MAKYLILYNSTAPASEVMAQATPEQMKASMEAWIAWKDEAVKVISFDFGMPLEAVTRITSDGVTDSDSHVSGYSIMEGDSKDTIIDLLKTHPLLQRPGSTIDVLEMLAMPGM